MLKFILNGLQALIKENKNPPLNYPEWSLIFGSAFLWKKEKSHIIDLNVLNVELKKISNLIQILISSAELFPDCGPVPTPVPLQISTGTDKSISDDDSSVEDFISETSESEQDSKKRKRQHQLSIAAKNLEKFTSISHCEPENEFPDISSLTEYESLPSLTSVSSEDNLRTEPPRAFSPPKLPKTLTNDSLP